MLIGNFANNHVIHQPNMSFTIKLEHVYVYNNKI